MKILKTKSFADNLATARMKENVANAKKVEYRTLTGEDGSEEIMSVTESLEMAQRFDVKEVKEEYYMALEDPLSAVDPDGKPYSVIVKGWAKLSRKKRDDRIEFDYFDRWGLIEELYDAEIEKEAKIEEAAFSALAISQ